MTATVHFCADTAHMVPTIDAVSRRADYVASLVAHTLNAIYAKAGIEAASARSCPPPAGFLLELGAVLQLLLWEKAGLTVHIEAGLPTADAAGQDLERRAKLGPSEFADVTRLDLWRRVNLLWTEHFAWDSEEIFGAEIALTQLDNDVLVNALADFLWKNRHIELTDDKDRQP